jgi:hypothetical protein
MMKIRTNLMILLAGMLLAICGLIRAQTLKVSENGRYLVREDGRPFFYLGDTGWDLFKSLDREETVRYLTNRAAKGFTVIQAVVTFGELSRPNAYGETPLEGRDPTRPNEAYFRHVDFVVDKAEELGLFIGMLPTWGNYWAGPDAIFTPENAGVYGEFLGKRYTGKPVIWILGGDENIRNNRQHEIIEAMAMGLRKGDGGEHLITYHPRGPGLSSDYLHREEWLDFNMYQSSHAAHDHDNGLFAEHDYALIPAKPTLDGEPRYETINVGFYFSGFNRLDIFDDYDCRQAAYWSLLAGACGHTYGNNSIFQFWQKGAAPQFGAAVPWYEAMDHPGAFQMGILKDLFTSMPWEKLAPAQKIILSGPREGGARIRAALAGDGSFALIYSPRGEQFTVDKSVLKGEVVSESWFDPRYGITYRIHASHTKGIQTYTPPTSGRGNDWLLILRDAAMEDD